MKTIFDIDWFGKIAVVRSDLNVPLTADGRISDSTRLVAALPTVNTIIDGGGGVVLLSHLGRPGKGEESRSKLSLRPIADALAKLLPCAIRFFPRLEGGRAATGEVVVHENVRFNDGERMNDKNLAQRYAALGDVFVMDAFASAHREESSVAALAEAGLPLCAGKLLQTELKQLDYALDHAERPLVGIFGGAKISNKFWLLRHMIKLCDSLLIGGGMANTLMWSQGINIGKSLIQRDMYADAMLLSTCPNIILPQDAVVDEKEKNRPLAEIAAEESILDIGAVTRAQFTDVITQAKTIIWNGPMGKFEEPAFAGGTAAVAQAIAASSAYSLIGGGDTIAAVRAAGVLDKMSYVSTGGGAMLEYLAGNLLPGLAALMR